PDLHLVRVLRHLKDNRPAILALDGRLLGDERLANDVGEFDHASASCNFSSAALVATTRSASATWRADNRALDTNSIRARLRTDRDSFSSTATSTSTALPVTPSRARSSAAAFVLISVAASSSTTISVPAWSFCASAAFNPPRSTFFGRA